MIVNGHIRLLFQDVVKPRCPFPASKARCVRAVVHHERNTPGMHVWIQTVGGLNDALIADLTVWVALQLTAIASAPACSTSRRRC